MERRWCAAGSLGARQTRGLVERGVGGAYIKGREEGNHEHARDVFALKKWSTSVPYFAETKLTSGSGGHERRQ